MARGRNDDTGDDQKIVHSKAIRGFARAQWILA